jgi:ribosomal protein L3 glutamine methyltransferase
MAARLRTLGHWLAWAEREYVRRGVALGQVADNAHDEALYLLLRTLGLPLDSKPAVLKRVLATEEKARVEEVFRRRIEERVPPGYLTGEAWLGGLRFKIDERVIIPRSYFVEIIPQLRDWLPRGRPVRRAVDVCTGSGCLAVLLAKEFPRAQVDAIELSPEAAAVAEENIRLHRLGRRVKRWRSDVFDAVPPAKYDIILSNPPYVPTRELRGLPEEFKREPALALDGGRDGLDVIRKLLRQARTRLQPHGIVVLEVGGLRAAMDRVFATLEPHWFHTADGEDCVCLFHAAHLRRWRG